MLTSEPLLASAEDMRDRCLIVTSLPMDSLQVSRHGVYQRLRMMIMAMEHTGLGLDLVCAEGTKIQASTPEAFARVSEGIFENWGVKVRVLGLTRSVKDTRTPYIIQQLMGCVSQRWTPDIRSAVAGGQLDVLQNALNKKPKMVLAHRLRSMTLLMCCKALPTCLFDIDDIEHLVHKRRLNMYKTARERFFAYMAVHTVAREERRAVGQAWKTLVCTNDDASVLANFCHVPSHRVTAVPNGQSLPVARAQAAAPMHVRHILLMVGVYSYAPNHEGARYFIEYVWPQVKSALPSAELWFVGSHPQYIGEVTEMPTDVRILGFVDDVEMVYEQAAVVICPILTGGGTRVKLIEAALRGKAIVSTNIGAEGLGFTDGKEALLRDNPSDMAHACLKLLSSPVLCESLGVAARSFAEKHFNRDAIVNELAALCVKKLRRANS